jgi:UDP-glucose 4-epimerase
MRWLITGGCGFIGANLIHALTTDGNHRIRVIDNLAGGTLEDLEAVTELKEVTSSDLQPMVNDNSETVEFIEGDIVDGPLAFKAAAGADVIVHLAANTGVVPSIDDPGLDCTVNVFGTLNMLEAARHNQVRRFVFASSGATIGDCTPPLDEKMAPRPASPYGASKLAGEGYCSAYFQSFGVETVSLRFGNVYGPGSGHKTSVVANLIRRAMQGLPLEIHGDGRQTRNFLFIGDLVRAIKLAATTPDIGGEIFQIATSTETTLSELLEGLITVLAEFGISPLEIRHADTRNGDVSRKISDISKATGILGWQPEVALTEGLPRTVAWFNDQEDHIILSIAN